jgi:transposase
MEDSSMMGKPVQRAPKLFHVGFNLEERVHAEHPLRRIQAAVDFSFVRAVVASAYGNNGHESLDPTIVIKLLFLCFYENVRSERELMRHLPSRLDWLWFCGLDLDDPIPHHSVLSKARRRWGVDAFDMVFQQILRICLKAGLISGNTVHADSTLLKANAALESRVPRQLFEQLEAAERQADAPPSEDNGNGPDQGAPATQEPAAAEPAAAAKASPGKLNSRLVSPVDPDAATSTRRSSGTLLGYRDHRLIDDKAGIILSTIATPANTDDGAVLPELLAKQEEYLHQRPREVVGDSMYGTLANYALLKEQGTLAYLKKRRGKDSPRTSWLKLLPEGCYKDRALYLLGRRRSRAEGSFAQSHERMNHWKCRWRRLGRVQMQCYLVAAVQNIKKLARRMRPSPSAGALTAQRERSLSQTGLLPAGIFTMLLVIRGFHSAPRWLIAEN